MCRAFQGSDTLACELWLIECMSVQLAVVLGAGVVGCEMGRSKRIAAAIALWQQQLGFHR